MTLRGVTLLAAPLVAGCASGSWERTVALDPQVATLQESAPESAAELTLSLQPVIEGRAAKAGTLYLQLALDATLTTIDGSRPVTSLFVFAEDPDEPVPQEARGTPTDEGVTLYRVGAAHPCDPREPCTVRYTVLFEQLGSGSVRVDWVARASAWSDDDAKALVTEDSTLSITAQETSL